MTKETKKGSGRETPAESGVNDRIKQIIAQQFSVAIDDLTDDRALESWNADELDNVELAMEFEDVFEINISDDEAGKFETVGGIIAFVNKKIEGKKDLTTKEEKDTK